MPASVTACDTCCAGDLCLFAEGLTVGAGEWERIVQPHGEVRAGRRLYQRNSPLKYIYLVCSGCIKTQRDTPDGSLVISGFHLPGDLLGIDAINNDRYTADAVATVDSEVCRFDYAQLLTHCASHPKIAAKMMTHVTLYAARKVEELVWMMGLDAQRLVLRFFLRLHDSICLQGGSDRETVRIPMRKQDIAHYLRMTPETFSRNLAALRRDGLLELQKNHFVFPDRGLAHAITQI